MNRDERIDEDDTPRPEHLAVDALLDGELVDRDVLRSALERADARDYLIDALMLRQMTRDMAPAHLSIPGTPRSQFVRRMRWLAAAAIVTVSAGAGYAYGKNSGSEATAQGLLEVVIDSRTPPSAPEPTRTIRFEPGVNWTAGGSH
jgi:hypothetical protein